jgi:hypothetical protein
MFSFSLCDKLILRYYDKLLIGRLLLAPQGQDSTLAISVGGTPGIPQSLAAQLGYAGTNARLHCMRFLVHADHHIFSNGPVVSLLADAFITTC